MATTYQLQEGDTLDSLKSNFGISSARLQSWNPGVDINALTAGQKINLPPDLNVSTFEGGVTDDDPATAPGLLGGGVTVRLRHGPLGTEDDIWYQLYEFPPGSGQYVSYRFDNYAQVVATYGGTPPTIATRTQSWWDQKVLAEGTATEVIGARGNFATMTTDLMRQAAVQAGIRDPGLAGQIASNPEMQQIMAQAMIGNWSEEQIRAAQRQTSYWKDVLYPGIDNLYNMTQEPEVAYRDYVNSVSNALSALGYQRDASGTFNAQIERMLDSKIDADVFLSQAPTFIRATQNAEFASVLNQWAEQDLGRDINFNDWFDLMAGESAPELESVAEKATLAWVAQNQGSNVSNATIADLAARSQLSEAEAVAVFGDFNRSILALGEEGLSRYGLSRDEVLSAAAGVDPQSGRNIEEVKLSIAKTARELALADDEKINFYVGFDPMGRPIRPGLSSLSPERA